MRRFATFIFLGPLLVWLTMFLLLVPELITKPSTDPLPVIAAAIPMSVVIGFVPAFILAGADYFMQQTGFSRTTRAVVCALLGYPVAVFGFYLAVENLGMRSLFADWLFIAGLYGIVPAAVCSWFSEKSRETTLAGG